MKYSRVEDYLKGIVQHFGKYTFLLAESKMINSTSVSVS